MKTTTESITYEEAVDAYLDWAKGQAGEPQMPNKGMSDEYHGIWHLENVNGPLAAVTNDKEVVPVTDFYAAYERLAEEGKCDSAGGMEYRRVLAEWIEQKPDDLDEFIVARANIGPFEIVTESPLQSPSKKLKVTLFGEEVNRTHTEMIVEVPADATKQEVEELGGNELESMVLETGEFIEWEAGDIESATTFDNLCVEDCKEDDHPALRLTRNDSGELVPDDDT